MHQGNNEIFSSFLANSALHKLAIHSRARACRKVVTTLAAKKVQRILVVLAWLLISYDKLYKL